MSIDRTNLHDQEETLFTASNGIPQWWNLRLFCAATGAPGGATATLKVNGNDIPEQRGSVFCQVNAASVPQRSTSVDVRLNDGDVVSVAVEGPSSINVSLSGDVASEQL